jgi:hypothetical protein
LIAGRLPGDQTYPKASFTTNGGYLLWEDNWIDGKGLGIGAMHLKSDLSGTGVPFRVNSLVGGDQENGGVTMLNNGGAAFVWQGGAQSFQHVYARFLSSSNNWVTGDVMVNQDTNHYQGTPAIATLLNGNVIVVYCSLNQAGTKSRLDVYGQIFTPDGQKVGSEFSINEFTANNQRSPAVAALADGKFAVAWVSEQQRWTDESNGVPSVDIYGRVFDGSGTALGDEFLMNVSSNLCAYPDLAASADGGFMATWMERDLVVRNNSWDVYARRFTGAGVGGNVTRVNTQLYGDQYSPKIRRAGNIYFDAWTSLGQDGSREGVYGQYLNDDATASGGEFRVSTTTFGSQMQQCVGSDGVARFLAVWTSLGGPGVGGFDLFAQGYVNPAAVVIGTDNNLFNTDPNDNSNSVSRTPPVPLAVNDNSNPNSPAAVVTNTFAQVAGAYAGLVYDPTNVITVDSGYLTVATTAQGSFTAKLQMGGKSYSFSGKFDSTGACTTNVSGLTVSLLLDLHGGDRITGQISNGTWIAQFAANRNIFSKTQPAPLSGTYTMIVSNNDQGMANGVGTVTVDASGNVSWSLTLPDGATASQKTTLSKTGQWPLFGTPYKSGGMIIGWMQFSDVVTNGFSGPCVWVKPAGTGMYASGLTNSVTVMGSPYKLPPMAFHTFGNSQIVFSGGDLSAPFTNSVTWGLNNKVSNVGISKLKLTLTSTSGLFKGTTVDPSTGHTLSFQGVLFEKGNVGLGFFSGATQSGAVNFAPNP